MGKILGGESYLALGATKKLTFWSESAQTRQSISCAHGPITCMVAQEHSGMIITGHDHGEIVIWHDIPGYLQASPPPIISS